MTKAKQTPSRFNKPSITSVIAITALFTALLALQGVWWTYDIMRTGMDLESRNQIDEFKQKARFEFCYNNNIRPCDNASIEDYNRDPANKDNRFYQ